MHDPGTLPAGTVPKPHRAVSTVRMVRVALAGLSISLASCFSNAEVVVPVAEIVLPESPQPATATLTGIVVDRDGSSIASARVVLVRTGHPSVASHTGPDGRFSFLALPAGTFELRVAAPGFATQQVSGELHPGDTLSLPATALSASSSTDVEVTATQADIAQAQIQEAERQRVLGVIPNFYVSYDSNPVPLNPRQKAELAYKTVLDPTTFAIAGVIAGVQQGTNTYPSWGQDAPAFGKRYAAAFGTFFTGTLLGNAVFPIVLKQDPRYFVKGAGTAGSRVLYALANSVICKGDSMRWQPNYSSILGNLAASGISNFYYPSADRQGASTTFVNAAIGIAATGAGNIFQEFLVRKLTPHTPKPSPNPASQPSAAKP